MPTEERTRFNKELEEFRHEDISHKLDVLFTHLWDIQGRLSAVEARATIWGGTMGIITGAIIGGFFYLIR